MMPIQHDASTRFYFLCQKMKQRPRTNSIDVANSSLMQFLMKKPVKPGPGHEEVVRKTDRLNDSIDRMEKDLTRQIRVLEHLRKLQPSPAPSLSSKALIPTLIIDGSFISPIKKVSSSPIRKLSRKMSISADRSRVKRSSTSNKD